MKIIVIDDEPKVRNGLSKILNQHVGWRVLDSFSEGESAIAFLKDNSVDVVVTDIRMPGMSGLDMIARMKETCRQVFFVILSGYGKFEYAQRAIELGVKKFLTKPTSPDEVIAALEAIQDDLIDQRASSRSSITTSNLLVSRTLDYVDLNYRKKFTLKDVAADLYVSPNYLSDLFKKHTGMKFSDHLRQVRMEKSKEFLLDVRYTVGDVAGLVGFSDQHYFSTTFRKLYGMTPLEYRNCHTEGQGSSGDFK